MFESTSPVEQLRAAVIGNKFTAGDAAFASDLIRNHDKRNSLSERQFFWVNKLIARAAAPAPVAATTALASSVTRVFGLFATAKTSGLKYPKIRLQLPEGGTVVFSQAGARSKYEGQVQITDGGRFGSNRYYGRIDQEGTLHEGRDLNTPVTALINSLASDPEGVASTHGHRTGECCFCSTTLTDGRSVTVGYGPVCAKRFGLAWGKQVDDIAVHVELTPATV